MQARRSIMFMFEAVTHFQIRIGIFGCCSTGRNFMIGGCARVTHVNTRAACTSPHAASEHFVHAAASVRAGG